MGCYTDDCWCGRLFFASPPTAQAVRI
jgi:hypothetical protein